VEVIERIAGVMIDGFFERGNGLLVVFMAGKHVS
jgi:hypothetical protein